MIDIIFVYIYNPNVLFHINRYYGRCIDLIVAEKYTSAKKTFTEFSTVVKMFRYSWAKHPWKFWKYHLKSGWNWEKAVEVLLLKILCNLLRANASLSIKGVTCHIHHHLSSTYCPCRRVPSPRVGLRLGPTLFTGSVTLN